MRELLDGALEAARGRSREAAPRRAEPRPQTLRLQRRLRLSRRSAGVSDERGSRRCSRDVAGHGAASAGARRRRGARADASSARRSSVAGSLLLSAAAGSGKTSVLVERFVARCRGRRRARRGSSRSLSPSAPRASCASACATGCSSSATARRRATPRRRSSARSTASARGCCARTRSRARPGSGLRDPRRGLAGRLREHAFASGAARVPRGGRRERAGHARRLRRRSRARRWSSTSTSSCAAAASCCRACPSPRRARTPARPSRGGGRACALLDELLARFARAYEQLKRARASARLRRSRAARPQLLGEHEAVREAWSRALRAADGRRVPGHQSAPAGDPARARSRQPVHGRRRAAVDLRLPPRRREPVSRASRRAGAPAARASR